MLILKCMVLICSMTAAKVEESHKDSKLPHKGLQQITFVNIR